MKVVLKKEFLMGVLSGAALTVTALFVVAQGWAHREGPAKRYFVAVDDSKPAGRASCEVLTGLGVAKRVLLGVPDASGHLPGCVLQVHGQFNSQGDFELRPRPDNFMDVAAWRTDLSMLTIKASRIKASCPLERYADLRAQEKPDLAECADFFKEKDALQAPAAT